MCVKYSYFGVRNADHNLLLRCTLYCVGRPTCSFSSSIIVVNIGNCHMIVTNGTIRHTRSNKLSHPSREPTRSLLKARFTNGASVFRVYNGQLQRGSIEERQAFNYDATGKSRSILRKIKSEPAVQSLLSSDVDESISRLREKFQHGVNADDKVPGAIQQICKYPCQIIVFTESSIRLFDTLLSYKNVVLSWDATGSVIQDKKNSPRLLYYELSITLPGLVSEDSIVPITFMFSNAHSLVNILR